MAPPVVSVVMPTFNGAAHLQEALASLLAQDFHEWELILVDDASSDDTLRIVGTCGDPRIKVVARRTNGGPATARSDGFALARGRYVAGLDQDDICRPDRLRRQVAFLDRHPGVVLVAASHSTLVDGRCRYRPHLRRSSPASLDWLLMVRNPLTWSTVMIRADALRRLDAPMRATATGAEDFDLYHRLRPFGRVARIDRDLLIYRDHPAGLSKRRRDRVEAAAAAVLAERYRPLFGADAAARAAPVVRHLGFCLPVADPATLAALRETLDAVRDDLLRRCDPADAAAIRRAAERSWDALVARSPASAPGLVARLRNLYSGSATPGADARGTA